jgi:hypothetical protein
MVLTSQGVSFLHAGDEILRSKPLPNGDFDHNSYQSPDSVNQIRWDKKVNTKEANMYDYFRGMIAFRKAHDAFRMNDVSAIQSSLVFNDDLYREGIIEYQVNFNGETYFIIHNAGMKTYRFRNTEIQGGYKVYIDADRASDTPLYQVSGGLSISIKSGASVVMKVDASIGQASFAALIGEFLSNNLFIFFMLTLVSLAVAAFIAWKLLPKSIKTKLLFKVKLNQDKDDVQTTPLVKEKKLKKPINKLTKNKSPNK